PMILEGRDVLAAAQTGTGKTAAFVLPILQRLQTLAYTQTSGRRPIRVLVVTPTRELCLQVEEAVRVYSQTRPIRSTAIYGGVPFDPQLRKLLQAPEIVVATPGRLLDHVEQKTIDLSRVEVLVLDEGDRMLDMGFIPDVRRIIALLPRQRQTLMFSATFSAEVRKLASDFQVNPHFIQIEPKQTSAESVRQVVIPVDQHRKRDLLAHMIKSGRIEQALVFTRMKHAAGRLADQLERDGIRATAIHGDKSQIQRNRALEDFKTGKVDILVATDVAARGLDIDALPHVINYELPTVAQDYVHRIGRTGRAGMDGDAISFVAPGEEDYLFDIQRLLKHDIDIEVIREFLPEDPDSQPRSRREAPEPRMRGFRESSPRGGSRSARGYSGAVGGSMPVSRPQSSGTSGPRPQSSGNQSGRPLTAMPGERLSRSSS
ncbi:MAG TPA: DEAD/DEAH box helicase, partial [Candidatus Limnocylindrales bacterium]|nr:DEAD/DEAH box helicase [Candidatus Limnocylindrales bacterium]